VLEIKVDAATPDNAQFLELERGASVVARINTDGSAEFASIEYPDGTVQNSAALAPVAYGYYRNGTGITSGSGNFTISYVSGSEYYLIDIPGVSYFFSSYTTLLTASSSNIKTIQESSLGGDLIVICEDSAGNRVQGSFQFIVYE